MAVPENLPAAGRGEGGDLKVSQQKRIRVFPSPFFVAEELASVINHELNFEDAAVISPNRKLHGDDGITENYENEIYIKNQISFGNHTA